MLDKEKKILVVDDDPVLVKMLEDILSKDGYKVVVVTEAADGLQIAIDRQFDLIILDVMMPIINGYNFCRLLKADDSKKNIPIIFLTSRDEEDDIAIGKEMGADAYFTKPVDTSALVSRIDELLQ